MTTNEKTALTAALQHVEPVVKIRFRGGDMLTTEPEAEGFTVYGARSVTIRSGDTYEVVSPESGIETYVQQRIRSALIAAPPAPAVPVEPETDEEAEQEAVDELMMARTRVRATNAIHNAQAALSAPPEPAVGDGLPAYDAGLLNDWGGGNVEWWQDYIRNELERAHEHYAALLASPASDLKAENERLKADNAFLNNAVKFGAEMQERAEAAEALSTALQHKLDKVTEALDASENQATYLEMAIREGDPKPELLLRIGDLLKEARAALQEVRENG